MGFFLDQWFLTFANTPNP